MHYVHQSAEISRQIEPANEKQDSQKRVRFYAQFDIEVVSALFTIVQAYKNKPPMGEVRKALLEAAKTRFREIKYSIDALPPKPPAFISWFEPKDLVDQTAVAAQTTSAVAAGSAEAHASVKVLASDEDTGDLLTEQVTLENKKDVKTAYRVTLESLVPRTCACGTEICRQSSNRFNAGKLT